MLSEARPVVLIPAITGVAVRAAVEPPHPVASGLGTISAFCREAAFLILVVLLIPVGILVIGTPITLIVRALIEIAERF